MAAGCLSTGFLQVGFAGVVASLWPVADLSAFFVMDRFYHLWRNAGIEPGAALCQAQCWLRDAAPADLAARLEAHNAFRGNQRLQELRARLLAMPDGARPFASLVSWAPFSFWGA